ncbi:MAG: hypothetical protein ABIO36_08860, partial [Pyrinomonadaceae bacterium]
DISASVKRLTGLEVSPEECNQILDSLGIKAKNENDISNLRFQTYFSPSWRHDLAIEEDLVEEVARHVGYENIASELPPSVGVGAYQETEIREKLLRQTLVNLGFDEAISYSFIHTKLDDLFETLPGVIDEKAGEKYITLQDSVIDGAVRMRPSILPGLLDVVRLNFNHKRRDLKLFEIGKVFASTTGENPIPNEQESFALVVTGGDIGEKRVMPSRELDFYDAKGAVETALEAAGVIDLVVDTAEINHLRSGQAASISVGGKLVGFVGRLNDEIAGTYKFKQPVYLAEINLQMAMHSPLETVAYRPLTKFPGIVRDVSFVVDRITTFASIRDSIVEQNYELCRNVMFVDIYEGKGLTEDERSITVRLEYRSDERTLIEDEVESLHSQIVADVEQKLSIKVRF